MKPRDKGHKGSAPVTIRPETAGDAATIGKINELAFDGPGEARLIEMLRERGKLLLSMVAERDGQVVGHIAFTRVTLQQNGDLQGAGLGPMSVLPAVQNLGIGSQLVREGLDRCREMGFDFAVVLGHPEYYPRFGFAPAHRFMIQCVWPVPDDVFMALEFRAGALAGAKGLVSYEPEFDEVA